jgi:hypothetical protein
MTTLQKDKIETAIDTLSKDEDIVALVKEIEGGVSTTKGNYGKYMQVMTQWGNASPVMLDIVSRALVRAGADSYGVSWAKRIINGGE